MGQHFTGEVVVNVFQVGDIFVIGQVSIRHQVAVGIRDRLGFRVFVTKGVDQRGDKGLVGLDLELLGFVGLDRVLGKVFCPAIGLRLPDQRLEGVAPECLMRVRELFPSGVGFQALHARLIQF